jgi:hypothetical protein
VSKAMLLIGVHLYWHRARIPESGSLLKDYLRYASIRYRSRGRAALNQGEFRCQELPASGRPESSKGFPLVLGGKPLLHFFQRRLWFAGLLSNNSCDDFVHHGCGDVLEVILWKVRHASLNSAKWSHEDPHVDAIRDPDRKYLQALLSNRSPSLPSYTSSDGYG